jgi:hypothetical protein
MTESKSGSGALCPNIDEMSDSEMCNGFSKRKESPQGNMSLFEECTAVVFLVSETTDLDLCVSFGETVSVSIVFGITSEVPMPIGQGDGSWAVETALAFQRETWY